MVLRIVLGPLHRRQILVFPLYSSIMFWLSQSDVLVHLLWNFNSTYRRNLPESFWFPDNFVSRNISGHSYPSIHKRLMFFKSGVSNDWPHLLSLMAIFLWVGGLPHPVVLRNTPCSAQESSLVGDSMPCISSNQVCLHAMQLPYLCCGASLQMTLFLSWLAMKYFLSFYKPHI